jgi:hypothetical protein
MPISFINDRLEIDNEIRLNFPTPLDFIKGALKHQVPPLPTLPVDLPSIPQLPLEILAIKAQIDKISIKSPEIKLSGFTGPDGKELSADAPGGSFTVPQASIDPLSFIGSIKLNLPSIPALPSLPVDLPSIPQLPLEILAIKAQIDKISVKAPEIKLSGFTGPDGKELSADAPGGSFTVPQAHIDPLSFIGSIKLNLPSIPALPTLPVDLPKAPDFKALFGNLGVDPLAYTKDVNVPSLPPFDPAHPDAPSYNPTGPLVKLKLFINEALVKDISS